jgi:hypothetical protein
MRRQKKETNEKRGRTSGHVDFIAELLLNRRILCEEQTHERGDICCSTQRGTKKREDVINNFVIGHLLVRDQSSQEAAIEMSQGGIGSQI